MKKNYLAITKILVYSILIFSSCKKEDTLAPSKNQTVNKEIDNNYSRLYVLNQGNMNENRCTIDFYSYSNWTYYSNIYPQINPTVVKQLGDVGNDLKIYGTKMYAVINMSNKIEVMDAKSVLRITQINVANPRYIAFDKGFAYISSYSRSITGSISGDNDGAKGAVFKVDTSTLKVIDSVVVGRQPEGIDIVNGKIYVANSGGYNPNNYERTVSVIDISTFKLLKNIDVAINLNLIQKDDENNIFVSSRGDYKNIPSKIFKIDTQKDQTVDSINLQANIFSISKDTLYVIGTPFSGGGVTNSALYFKTINTKNLQLISNNFISQEVAQKIQTPYALLINPISRNIYLSDALDYQTSGNIYCFSPKNELIWTAKAGQIPAQFALLTK